MDGRLKQEIENFPEEGIKILDLGCNNSYDYINLYREFLSLNKSLYYVGVDLEDEFDIFAFGRERYDYEPFKVFDNSIHNNFGEQFNDKFNLTSIKEKFTFFYETDALDFVNSLKVTYFDVIILSNLLHKIEFHKALALFTNCLTHLSPDGRIYVCVLHEQSGYNNEVNLFSFEQFNSLKKGLDVIYEKVSQLYYIFIAKKQ